MSEPNLQKKSGESGTVEFRYITNTTSIEDVIRAATGHRHLLRVPLFSRNIDYTLCQTFLREFNLQHENQGGEAYSSKSGLYVRPFYKPVGKLDSVSISAAILRDDCGRPVLCGIVEAYTRLPYHTSDISKREFDNVKLYVPFFGSTNVNQWLRKAAGSDWVKMVNPK